MNGSRFKNASTSVKHGEGAGRQSTSFTDADMERVYGMILQKRQVTVDEMAHQLQISRDSAYESIHNRHAFHKVCAWGSKATHRIAQRETFGHLQTAFGFLWFLERIVTEDETWTHHYEPESKHQSMDWKHRHSPTKEKFKTHSTAGKLMLTVFGTLSRDWLNNEQCRLQ